MRLVSARVVSEACGVRDPGTVLEWARKGIVPCVAHGKQSRFDVQAVMAALQAHRSPKTRRCTKCRQELPVEEFRARPDPRCRQMVILGDCRACHLAYKAARRRAQAEAQGRRYRTREEISQEREERRKEQAGRVAARKAARRMEPRETPAQNYRRRYRDDPEFYRRERARLWVRKRRRRAIEKGSPKVERIHVLDVAQRDGWRCAICSKRVTKKTWSIDHLVPLSKGGEHTMRNVVLAHKRCNSRRGAGHLPSQASLCLGGSA